MKVGHSDLVLCVCVWGGGRLALSGKVQELKEFQRLWLNKNKIWG